MKVRCFVAMLLIPLLLSGCWDKTELEERGLVLAIGLDKAAAEKTDTGNEAAYRVSLSIPKSYNSKTDENSKNVKTAESETIASAMKLIDSESSLKLYYGHTKVCVLSADALKDSALLKEAVDGLERNREISRKLILLAADGSAEEIIKTETDTGTDFGIFVSDFYKNNSRNVNITFRQDLEGVIQQLLSSGCAVIPKISADNGRLSFGGMAVIKDYKLAGWLNNEQTRGYMWIMGFNNGGEITAAFEDSYVPLRISAAKTKKAVRVEDGKIILNVSVDVYGNAEEYMLNSSMLLDGYKNKMLQAEYERRIREEMKSAIIALQNEFSADIIGFGEELRKNENEVYNALGTSLNSAFENAEVQLSADVTVKGSGAIK